MNRMNRMNQTKKKMKQNKMIQNQKLKNMIGFIVMLQ